MFTLCTFFVTLYHKKCNTQNILLLDIIHIEHSRQLRRAIEVPLQDGLYTTNTNHWDQVLDYCKTSFINLFKSRNVLSSPNINEHLEGNDLVLNAYISIVDVKRAVVIAKVGKTFIADNVYAAILKNYDAVLLLHSLLNICFINGNCVFLWWQKAGEC